MDHDMAFGSILGSDKSWLWVEMAKQVEMVLVTEWLLDNTKALGCVPNPESLCDLW